MTEPVWYHLRATRSDPPGLAATDAGRRRTFVAALEQFEELMEASLRVSAASRPLPMFYALAQAGRAIVAAYASDTPPRMHGLSLNEPELQLMRTSLVAQKGGWYQAVSATTGSPAIERAALGQAWSAIPDLVRTPLPDGEWPKALQVVPTLEKFPFLEVPSTSSSIVFDPWPSNPAEVLERLKGYPTAGRHAVAHVPGSPDMLITDYTDAGQGVRVYFSVRDGEKSLTQARLLEERAPEYRFYGQRWLIPGIEQRVVSPLMLWWLLLFGLSMLARYYPGAWIGALDLNESRLAVPIEDSLDIAQTAVPHLVLEALIRQPVRFRG